MLSFLFVPLTRLSHERKRTIWITTFAVIAGLFALTFIITSFLASDSSDVETIPQDQNFQNNIETISSNVKFNLGDEDISLSKFVDAKKIGEIIGNLVSGFLSGLGTFFTEFILVMIFLMFLLPSHDATINKISKKMDAKGKEKFCNAMQDIEKNIRTYLTIKSAVSLLTAILSGLVMFFFGVKFLILFMFLIFMLNFIPSIGSFIAVSIVLGSDLFISGFSISFIFLAILLIAIQIIIGNILEPKVSGKQLELSPIFILLSLFFWGSVWGIGGMFFAVPLTSIIKIILQNIDATKKFVPFIS
ncbi:MAG: AI-2E family transporter [Nanoarchaeota archaeon]|nr:AI-2E family transporter [Nanoarchaeota archaeon]